MDNEIQMVSITMAKGQAIALLQALKTQFTVQGLAGAKTLLDMCDAIEEALISSEVSQIHDEER